MPGGRAARALGAAPGPPGRLARDPQRWAGVPKGESSVYGLGDGSPPVTPDLPLGGEGTEAGTRKVRGGGEDDPGREMRLEQE